MVKGVLAMLGVIAISATAITWNKDVTIKASAAGTVPLTLQDANGEKLIEFGAGSATYNSDETNTIIGIDAGNAMTNARETTLLGFEAGLSITGNGDPVNNSLNTFLGSQAGRACTTGQNNTAVGQKAGVSLTTGGGNVFLGKQAGNTESTSSLNVYIGQTTARDASTHTAGGKNIAIGPSAFFAGTGTENVFMGYFAGGEVALPTGSRNTVIGSNTALALTSAVDCTSVGQATLAAATSPTGATAVGAKALTALVGGNYNTALGYYAGYTHASGFGNIFLGAGSGDGFPTGGANTFIAGGDNVSYQILDVHFGKGYASAAPTAYTINGTGGSGTNIAGEDVVLAGGKGTGTGAAGVIGIKYPLVTTTGTTLQSLSTAVNIPSGVVYTATASVTLTASTSTTGTLVGAQTGVTPAGTLTMDANIWRPGRIVRVKAYGRLTTSAAGPTLTLDAKLGSTVIATTGAVTPLSAITNGAFSAEAVLVCQTVGAGGTIQGDGMAIQANPTTFVPQAYDMYKAVTTVDTTTAQAIDFYATWSAGTAGNAITIYALTVEFLN